MKETAVFFDLDDTLYDRSEPFIKAFLSWYPDLAGIAKEAYWTMEKRGNEVFLPSQRGEITMDEMYIYRYQKGFADVGVTITADQALEFQRLYRTMQKEITLAPGIRELLTRCREACKCIGIITNGPADKQKGKLASLQMQSYIPEELTLISGVLKIDKPDPAIFHLAEERSGTSAGNMIFVGDSLANDIAPAHTLGWKTIYLNKKNKPLTEGDSRPDLVVDGEEILTFEMIEGCL